MTLISDTDTGRAAVSGAYYNYKVWTTGQVRSREGRGEECERKHMSLDFVYPPMVTPQLIHLNLGPLKELQTHGRKRVNNVYLLRARARSLDLS